MIGLVSKRANVAAAAVATLRLATRAILVGAALALLLPPVGLASAADGALSRDDQTCLACHGQPGMEKDMAEGEKLSLQIKGKAFAASVHNAIGCSACHADIDLAKHPAADKKKQTLREFSIAKVAVCRQCHEDKSKLYEESIHAALLREGNPMAPLCSDCHAPHAVLAKAAASGPIAEVPCRKCHGAVFKAYAQSVHGLARAKDSNGGAPICADCHRAHDVTAAASGNHIKEACLACHFNALQLHKSWLPNAAHHFEAVSCPACHAPMAPRRVDLKLYDSSARERVAEKSGVPRFESRAMQADSKGQGLDALALQSLLKEFNHDNGDTILRGRLEVDGGPEAHMLAAKGKAIKDCKTCHREGAAPFQKVTISIVGPDGRPLRHGAQQDVLQGPTSIDSVRGFYAIGGTRIKLLDILLVLALASGIAVPVGHLSLKWLFRKYPRQSSVPSAQENSDSASDKNNS